MAEYYPPIDWTQHALHTAAASGNASEVERLIADGADVNEELCELVDGTQGVAGTPLHVAICSCGWDNPSYREVVEVLLKAGAKTGLRRKWDGTPLHDAARKGLIEIARRLIRYGADVNTRKDWQARTPLHFAAACNQLRMVDFLLSSGAELDVVSYLTLPQHAAMIEPCDIGMTPLHLASREGHVAMVRRLIDAGASLEIRKAVDLIWIDLSTTTPDPAQPPLRRGWGGGV